MSQQPTTVRYLCGIFENLDPAWVELLVSQFPTQGVDFLTEQCFEELKQINMKKEKTNHNNDHNHNKDSQQKPQVVPHHDSQQSNASNLSPDQHNFLYSQQPIDSEDEVIMNDKITDQGPSLSLLSSVPKELSLWFESFSKSLPTAFQPGLLEILLHLEMVKYNTAFAFSPKPNAAQTNDDFVQSLEFLLTLLNKLESGFDDANNRMFSRSDKQFCDKFKPVQGSEILLKYTGWTLIETDKSDDGGLYVYDEENDKEYLRAIIVLLTMYRDYLNGDKVVQLEEENNNRNKMEIDDDDAPASHEWQFNNDNQVNKNNNFHRSIFESDDDDEEEDKLDEKELLLTPRDSDYVTRQPSVDTPTQAKKIQDMIDNVEAIDVPRDLNVNEFVLRRRGILYGANKNANVSSHQWPQKVPGYALMEEHKQNNIHIYSYTWDEFPSHKYKYLAMECELNKFSRIGLNVFLRNCNLNDVASGSDLDDVQIFCIPQDNELQVSTEMGPFEKKLIFTVKFASHTQLPYSWKYNGMKITLNDITQYIKYSNDMLSEAVEKYLTLYRRYDLHKVADKVPTLYNILTQKLNVSCFIDLEFPPLSASLMSKTHAADVNNKAIADMEDTKAFEGLIWKRAIDFAEYPHVFGPVIMLSDVEQGKLGNCGFAASLTAISAKYPQLIKKLFLFPAEESVSAIGLYEISLCHNGIWRQYTIDDLIPCNYGGNAAFTRHENGNFLWVSLIEKCAAKAYGGYDRLIAFCKLNAFNDLTGCPVEEIDFDIFDDDSNVLWKHLLEWSENKYIVMTLAATMERSKRSISDLGITGNHAFTFVRAVEVENIRLIQIRNPWGKCIRAGNGVNDRWKGDYSRYNKKGEWTQTLRDIVRPQLDNNDGTFWMNLHDFMQYFCSASLCHLLSMDPQYKICKIRTKIEYNFIDETECEDISYPKLILDLSAMDNSDEMELEWLGMQQENLRSQYAIHQEYLDCCLLIAQLLYPNDREKCASDLAAYIEPIRITECRKSKTEFEKIYANLRGGQKYLLIPYSTGITFHKNYKTLKKHQARNVNISLYIKHKSGLHINEEDEKIKLQYQKSLNIEAMKPILTHFVQQLGKKQENGDLEYSQATFGTLTLSAIRHTKLEQIMGGTFSFDLVNMLPAIGFDQGFILKNNICKKIVDDENKENQDNLQYDREWKWIYTVHDLKYLETELFVLGQYQRFKRQQWKFNPEIFFTSIHNNNNNFALF